MNGREGEKQGKKGDEGRGSSSGGREKIEIREMEKKYGVQRIIILMPLIR
jgi:hypothetical protein